jgi:outer membrane lipoprotein-sorting protein
MKFLRRLPVLLLLATTATTAATAARADDVAAFIAKARAAVGSEDVLAKVASVHYIGTVELPDAKAGAKTSIDVLFQNPYRQRITVTTDTGSQTTGLDGYSAWIREERPADPKYPRLGLLGVQQVRRMRANTWENLAFYSGIEHVDGHVEDAGTVQLDGQPARKLIFWHDNDVFFARWFDPVSGQLLQTETDDGNKIREAGEILSGGLRFPRQIITVSKGPNGATNTSTITFDTIKVNEPAPDSAFAVPLPPPRSANNAPPFAPPDPTLTIPPPPDHTPAPPPDPGTSPLFPTPNVK